MPQGRLEIVDLHDDGSSAHTLSSGLRTAGLAIEERGLRVLVRGRARLRDLVGIPNYFSDALFSKANHVWLFEYRMLSDSVRDY